MRKRTATRGTAPTPGAVAYVQEKVDKAMDLVRSILLRAEGTKYSISIEGRRIVALWQAVPGYSDSVYFIPEDFTETLTQYVVRCSEPAEVTVRTLNGTICNLKVTAKHNFCTKEEIIDVVDCKILKRSKTLDIVFNKATSKILPLRYNGKLN
jgi:hypothetical protein